MANVEIFVQRFRGGDAADADADASAVEASLRPYLVHAGGYVQLRVGTAEAAIYGLDNLASGFMLDHADAGVLDVLADVAVACDLVVMPVGCPVAIMSEAQRAGLPDEFAADAVVVTSGDDLRTLIEAT